jgi:hypothetical protein
LNLELLFYAVSEILSKAIDEINLVAIASAICGVNPNIQPMKNMHVLLAPLSW